MNHHPYVLAQYSAGRFKAFPEDFPSPASTTHTNFCFTQPVPSTLGFLCCHSPVPQLNWLLPQSHLRWAGLCCCGVTQRVLISSPSLCHGCILPNDLQAVPVRHQLLSSTTSLGGMQPQHPGIGFPQSSQGTWQREAAIVSVMLCQAWAQPDPCRIVHPS